MQETFVAATAGELWSRIEAAHRQLDQLSRCLLAGDPVHGSSWTHRELVAHLVTVLRRYTERDTTRREGLSETPRGVDVLNARELATLADRPLTEMREDLRSALETLRARFGPGVVDLEERFEFHGGLSVDNGAALANVIGELLVHRRDLAVANGWPWSLERRDAELVIGFVLQVVPAYARRDVSGSLSLQLRVPGAPRWHLAFEHGGCRSRPSALGDRPDVVVRAPAQVLLLGFYSRLTVPSMARRGALVLGGRRPWRVLDLPRFIEQP